MTGFWPDGLNSYSVQRKNLVSHRLGLCTSGVIRKMSRRSFLLGFLPFVAIPAGLVGCGGATKDAPKQVEVTDELKRQAEASDAFFNEQNKKKAAPKK